MHTPEIETQRLKMVLPSVAYADEIFRKWTSDKRVTRYMIYTTHESPEDTRIWLEESEKNISDDRYYEWCIALKETGELIGSGGFHFRDDIQRWELGYNFACDFWHKGFGSEFAKGAVEFAINKAGLKHFFCQHAEDNIYSGKVMENAGFSFVRTNTYTCPDGRVFQAKQYHLDAE